MNGKNNEGKDIFDMNLSVQTDEYLDQRKEDIVREMLEQEEENRLLKSVLDERKLMAEFYLRSPELSVDGKEVFERELQTIERIVRKFGLEDDL